VRSNSKLARRGSSIVAPAPASNRNTLWGWTPVSHWNFKVLYGPFSSLNFRQIHGDGECGARAGHRHEVRHSFTALTEHVYHNHPGPHYNVKCRSISNDSAPDPHETRAFCTPCCTCVPCGSLSCLVDTTLRRPAIPRTLAKGPGPRTPDMRTLRQAKCGQRRVQSGKAMNLRKLL
jgi:hypothetical protein